MTMRVGIWAMPFTPDGIELVRQAERLGVDWQLIYTGRHRRR